MEHEKQIVIAGAGYAGLHIAQRIGAKVKRRGGTVTLVDQHDYHQLLTELPRVAAGTRAASEVRVPLAGVLGENVRLVHGTISGFDFAARQLHTEAGALPYTRLVLALGSRPNDFGITGLREHALSLWSVDDAKKILAAIDTQIAAAAHAPNAAERQRLLSVVIGGGGATGVELAAELAEVLPALVARHDMPGIKPTIVLVEAGSTLLVGSSAALIQKALDTLQSLGVQVRLNSMVLEADARGFTTQSGERIEAGTMVWAGGVKAPELVARCGLPTGRHGRIAVEPTLRVIDHPEIYVAGDLAYLIDEGTGRALPPTAQIALEEGDTVATNLLIELDGDVEKLVHFEFKNKGYVVSLGQQSGVADVGPLTLGGRPAMLLKNAIEWEYRQSVKHLQGWSPM